MAKRVRVRRDRPAAPAMALALAVTMLAVYLIARSAPTDGGEAALAGAREGRVTREIELAGVEVYCADLGCCEDDVAARILAASFAPRGAAGVVRRDASGWHVLGAAYALEADAQRAVRQLAERDGVTAQVWSLAAAPLTLRITAPAADIDAIAAADAALTSQIEGAAALAARVDRGEVGDRSARTLAALAESELEAARTALAQVAGAAEDAVCASLLDQLAQLADALGDAARGSDAGAALSGRLRSCQIAAQLRRADALNALR